MALGRVPKRVGPALRKLKKRVMKVCGEWPGAGAVRKGGMYYNPNLSKNCKAVLKRWVKLRDATKE